MEGLAESRTIERDGGDAALQEAVAPPVQFFLHGVGAVEKDDHRSRPLARRHTQIALDQSIAERRLERSGRHIEER